MAKCKAVRRHRTRFFESLEARQLLSAEVELRLADQSHAGTVSSVGQVINFEIWVKITGSNGTGEDDGVQDMSGTALSGNKNGGSALGTIQLSNVSPFTAPGAVTGTQRDVDGDADLDVGNLDDSKFNGQFFARSGSVQVGGTTSGPSAFFKIGEGTFTVTSLLSGSYTYLWFRPRIAPTAGVWIEDGKGKSPLSGGTLLAGQGITLTRPPSGSISGRVFKDNNADGIFDGNDTGIGGVRVFLDKNNNGVRDAGETQKTTTSTGTYTFSALPTFSYAVRCATVPNTRLTTANPVTGKVLNGQAVKGRNIGWTSNIFIKGTVWSDSDKDGVIDAAEAKLGGWTVYADLNKNGILDGNDVSVTTNAKGEYRIVTLAAGSYDIRAVAKTGYRKTTNSVRTVILPAGGAIGNRNFGFKKL